MADDDDTDNKQGLHEPPDAAWYASAPPAGGYAPHPLLPREEDGLEFRDIQFLMFCRRRSDGNIDVLFEEFRASEVRSWADVIGLWGGGEYRVIAKDKDHRILGWHPSKDDVWMRFDGESTPFTLPEQRPGPDPLVAAFPGVPEPPPPPRKKSVIELCSLCHPRMTVCGKAG